MGTSVKQRQANKKNAQKSTGPKTGKGKAMSKYNAVKHGLTATSVLLPDEKRSDLEKFAISFYNDLQPVGPLEMLLVERIVFAAWRLLRFGRVEAGIYTWNYYGEKASRASFEARLYTKTINKLEIKDFSETVVTDKEAHDAAIEKANKAWMLKDSDQTVLGRAFVADCSSCDALGKLNRYETTISRGLYAAIRELKRLQKERKAASN